MNLSLFTDYSLRVLMYAAVKGDVFQVDEVTAAYGISRHHLAKVVHSLGKLGYLDTRRGRGGGLQLARKPEEIRLGQLVRETEGGSKLIECFDAETNTCILNGSCRLKGVLAEALGAFYEKLDGVTLQDVTSGAAHAKMSSILLAAK